MCLRWAFRFHTWFSIACLLSESKKVATKWRSDMIVFVDGTTHYADRTSNLSNASHPYDFSDVYVNTTARRTAQIIGPKPNVTDDTEFSYHSMVLFTYCPRKGQDPVRLLSWNPMLQERPEHHLDSAAEFENKVSDSIDLLLSATLDLKADIVFLQESSPLPPSGHEATILTDALKHDLPEGYTVLIAGELVTVVNGDAHVIEPLPQQIYGQNVSTPRGNIQAAYSPTLNCILLNVHFPVDLEDTDDGKAKARLTEAYLKEWIDHARHIHPDAVVVIGGDTNRVPAKRRGENAASIATVEQLKEGIGFARISVPDEPSYVKWDPAVHEKSITWSEAALWLPSASWEWPEASQARGSSGTGSHNRREVESDKPKVSLESGTARVFMRTTFLCFLYGLATFCA